MINKLLPIFALIAAVAIAFFAGRCGRDADHFAGDTNVVHKAEPIRQRVVAGRDKMNEQLAIDTLKYLTQLEAHSRTISRLMANGKQKDRELAALHAKYAKKPTLALCDTLVKEQKGRIDSLRQEVAVHRKDSVDKAYMLKVYAEHLFDKDLRIDSLNTGWKQANVNNADLDKQLQKEKGKVKKRNTLLKIGGGIIAVLAGVIAIR